MFDAVYLIKDSGILLLACRSERLKKQHQQGNARDDLVSAFFTAINQFTVTELGEEGIEHIQLKNNKCLYFKDINVGNCDNIKLAVFASGDGKKDVTSIINAKAIELKWGIKELIDDCKNGAHLSSTTRAKIEAKITALFLS